MATECAMMLTDVVHLVLHNKPNQFPNLFVKGSIQLLEYIATWYVIDDTSHICAATQPASVLHVLIIRIQRIVVFGQRLKKADLEYGKHGSIPTKLVAQSKRLSGPARHGGKSAGETAAVHYKEN